jgi:uncharacterized protein YeaO (DUF488 family)
MPLRIKRVYERPSPQDGVRILVDRLWPRGLRKDAAALDHWCKDIAPSPELRKWFDHREDRFDEFRDRYRLELKANPSLAEFRRLAGSGKVTLLYAAHDEKLNHAVVLAEYTKALKAAAPSKR